MKPDNGLNKKEARCRLAENGPNELAASPLRNIRPLVLDVLWELMFLLLVACGAVYMVLGDRGEAPIPSAKAILIERATQARRWTITSIEATQPLSLVDLTSPGLRRIGLSCSDLIDTNAASYPFTQKFAKNLFTQFPTAQGIRWVSRLYDEGVCIVLWDERIASGILVQSSIPVSVFTVPTMSQILDLVDQLDMRYLP